jgi:hypothetical protein
MGGNSQGSGIFGSRGQPETTQRLMMGTKPLADSLGDRLQPKEAGGGPHFRLRLAGYRRIHEVSLLLERDE